MEEIGYRRNAIGYELLGVCVLLMSMIVSVSILANVAAQAAYMEMCYSRSRAGRHSDRF
jgi:hypothetical protein